jgi:hypothetical protein
MMAQLKMGFLPLDKQLFDLGIGEAMAALVRQRYPRDTAKHLSRQWNIDASTAANVVKGHCSERTLTKAIRAEGWSLIQALGATITGETFEQYEERRLNQIITEAENARQNLVQLRARRQAVESRATDVLDAFDGSLVGEIRGAESRSWAPNGQRRNRPAGEGE